NEYEYEYAFEHEHEHKYEYGYGNGMEDGSASTSENGSAAENGSVNENQDGSVSVSGNVHGHGPLRAGPPTGARGGVLLECQRHLFSLPADVHYLNCAYMSPLLRSVEEAGVAG